ncbi:carbohydrate sulfotransferase [Elysia marginata]|uniref:Carbohydrate sulfotransferase n=1 Tax=Elysia marginata TaxID=1093978 RepID=A0AAV4FXR5_9GAST|nr:carbohydrate sulfotransferase [Elysia marginata]
MSLDLGQLSLAKYPEDERRDIAGQAFTFMFARNPFHRMFSAYCDKLFMLAPQTGFIVKHIRKSMRREQLQRQGAGENFIYMGPEYNITFAQALVHAIQSRDPHFLQISKQCNPCDINFNVLGRMESLDIDSRYILTKLNRSHIMENTMECDEFRESRDQGIIEELVQRVFSVLKRKKEEMSKFKALVRTWKVFHIRGLVRDDISFPLSVAEAENASVSRITELGVAAMHRSGTPAERLAQRDKYYKQAFRSVSLADILRFSRSVTSDCRLFGYDCYPAEIYHGRQEGDEEDNIFSNDKYIYDGLI